MNILVQDGMRDDEIWLATTGQKLVLGERVQVRQDNPYYQDYAAVELYITGLHFTPDGGINITLGGGQLEREVDGWTVYDIAPYFIPEEVLQTMDDEVTPKPLDFATLRQANMRRLPSYACEDWTIADWMVAVMDEFGELAKLLKKTRHGDLSMEQALPKIEREFADVVTYLDVAAQKLGVDLGEATRDKFNEVSVRIGSPVRISDSCQVVDVPPDEGSPS